MKQSRRLLAATFAVVYALILGLGMTCLLNLEGIALAAAAFGDSLVKQYPRFIPFCLLVGTAALIALIVILMINRKVAAKLAFTGKMWWVQMISAAVLSLPALQLWAVLFEWLQKTF